jgi:hypothetical protein
MSEIEIYQSNQRINNKTRGNKEATQKLKLNTDSRYIEVWVNDELVFDSEENYRVANCGDCEVKRFAMNHGGS